MNRGFLGRRRSSSSRSGSSRQSFSSFSSCKQSFSGELAPSDRVRHQQQRQSHVRIRSPSLDSHKNDDSSIDYNTDRQQQTKNQEDLSTRTTTTQRDESTNSSEYELHHDPSTKQPGRKSVRITTTTDTTAESTSGGEDNNNDDNNNNLQRSSSTPPPPPDGDRNSMAQKPSRLAMFRQICGHFINDTRVQVAIIVLIVANALLMGLGTFDWVTENPNVQQAFETTDRVFLTVFTLEILLQFVYHGWQLFVDGWLLFDFLIVVVSWSFDSLQVIRAFRVFRAIRLVTRLEILKNLVQAIFDVAPSLLAILSLLMLVLYIYAVMCTVLFKDLYEMGVTDIDYFGRLDMTLFSLFSMMTLEGWGGIVRQVMTEYYWAPIIFCTFLVFSSFILYSLIIAVVCDAVTETEHHDEYERAELAKQETKQQIKYLEQRIQEMTHQQAVLLESLQQVLEQVEFPSPQAQSSKKSVSASSSWLWSRRSSDQ